MEIAHCWFNKLNYLTEQGLIVMSEFQADLANKTLVGEYVGNQEHQHMVLYNRETLMFYAVVDNYSPHICQPIDQAIALLKKHHMDVVFVESLGVFNTFNELCDGLCKAFRDVAKGKIVDEEEGSVLYLTSRHSSGDASLDQVLSLSKLKTIEYRIFRKMREKLRGYFNQEKTASLSKSSATVVTNFKNEMVDILKGNETPKPMEYYINILEGAFTLIRERPSEI